jgi:cell wall-associated NlpC family hydrolase
VRRLLATITLLAGLLALGSLTVPPPAAHAAVRMPAVSSATLGDRVLNKAETRAGDWYQWAAAGPSTFDCSGLVVWAAAQLRVYVPHSTYSMLAGVGGHLYRIPVSQARRGDLMFYGSGHVEINTGWYHTTFGAQRTGTRVWWHPWSGWWAPTMAMRFR